MKNVTLKFEVAQLYVHQAEKLQSLEDDISKVKLQEKVSFADIVKITLLKEV